MKKNYPSVFIFLLVNFSLSVNAQWLSQKLQTPPGGTVEQFGDGAKVIDENTIIVAEPDWLRINGKDTISGAVFIYKKTGKDWTLKQTLSSGSSNGFGVTISKFKNTLAVSAHNEDIDGLKDAGALYFYKRVDSTSDFVFQKKLTDSVPTAYSNFGYVGDFNENYILISGNVYRFEKETLKKLILDIDPRTWPWYLSYGISNITDNGHLVSFSEGIGMFKVVGDSIKKIDEIFLPDVGKGGFYGEKILNGNTIGTTRYGQDGTSYWLITINDDGSLSSNFMEANPYSAIWGNDAGNGYMALKDKRWMFADFSLGIIAFRYHKNQFYKAGTIQIPSDYKTRNKPFGSDMLSSKSVLMVHDPEDSTNRDSPGSLHLLALGEFLSDSLNGKKTKYPFKDAGDNFATGVAIDNDLAIIGAVDNDIADSNGTAFIYRKENGAWNFISKIAPRDKYFYTDNEIGNAIKITDNHILIGAPRGLNQQNSLQTGFVLIYSKEPDTSNLDIRDDPYVLLSPHEISWADTNRFLDANYSDEEKFGYCIAADSIFTAVSAPIRDSKKGVVYIFGKKDNYDFTPIQELAPDDLAKKSEFGHTIAMKGKNLIVGAPAGSSTSGAYFYQVQGDTFVYKQRFTGESGFSKPASSVAISNDFAFAAPGKGNFVQIYSIFGSSWSEAGKLVPFRDSASIEVAVDKNTLLVSSNNEDGNAIVVRYELFGNKWLKTGMQTLGLATQSPVKLCIKETQFVAAYKNDERSNESYALFGSTADVIKNNVIVNSTETLVDKLSNGILSPNPYNSGRITLHANKATYVEILSIESGSVIKGLDVKEGQISPENLLPGMYLVKIHTPEGVNTEKLVVQ
ncbi:MAG: T9SS type A sorting domain-containing protein [Opitutaceae bacterium]|nr:T9SS type A sorting domain-containing protein [Cytophagales bacterium]